MGRPRKLQQTDTHAETIERLMDALAPFAEHGEQLRRTDPRATSRKELYGAGRHTLTMAEFDRAAALMREIGQ